MMKKALSALLAVGKMRTVLSYQGEEAIALETSRGDLEVALSLSKSTRAFVAAVVFFLLSLSSGLLAAEWHVAPPPLGNDSNPGTQGLPFATIQRGIDASSNGGIVVVAEGTYVENIHFHGKSIVLTSTDPLAPAVVAGTIIDGNHSGSVVTFSGTEKEA